MIRILLVIRSTLICSFTWFPLENNLNDILLCMDGTDVQESATFNQENQIIEPPVVSQEQEAAELSVKGDEPLRVRVQKCLKITAGEVHTCDMCGPQF